MRLWRTTVTFLSSEDPRRLTISELDRVANADNRRFTLLSRGDTEVEPRAYGPDILKRLGADLEGR